MYLRIIIGLISDIAAAQYHMQIIIMPISINVDWNEGSDKFLPLVSPLSDSPQSSEHRQCRAVGSPHCYPERVEGVKCVRR